MSKKSVSDKAKERWANPEFREKMQAKLKAFWADKENKKRMQASMTEAYTKERKEKLSSSLKAHVRTPEHAAHISESLKGKPNWAKGTTKENSLAQAKKSESVIRSVVAKAIEEGVQAFPGQRTAVLDGRVIRYCMCSPVCMAEVTRKGRRYFGTHGADTDEVTLKISKALRGKSKPEGHGAAVSKALMGHQHSEETKHKIGATKVGKPNWAKGLTKDTDPRIKKISVDHVGKMPGSFAFRVEYSGPRGEVTFRSNWELYYAQWLDLSGIAWEYECKTFLLEVNGQPTSYTPDFYLPEFNEYVEVKGHYSEKNKAKMEAFNKAYPLIKVNMVFEAEMKKIIAEVIAKTVPSEDKD